MMGPYRDRMEAQQCLGAYGRAVHGRQVGLLWTSGGGTAWLQPPIYDANGEGLSLMVRCTQTPPPPAIQLPSLHRIEGALISAGHYVAKYGPRVVETGMGLPPGTFAAFQKYVVNPVDHFLNAHPAVKDGVIVVADVAGVVAGVAAAVTLATVGGTVAVVVGLAATVVAGGACLLLLVEDAKHLWYVARNDEAGRLNLEAGSYYQWVQAIAPWFTLPDLAIGGRTVVREAMEATKVARSAAPRVARYAERAEQAKAELKLTMAEDGSAAAMRKAADAAQRRAAELKRMQAAAHAASRNMLLKQNAVVGTAGTVWASRQYIHEPPKLVAKALGLKEEGEHGKEQGKAHEQAAKRLGGTAAKPGSPAHLLTPRHPAPGAANNHLQITPIITRRAGR